MEITPVRKSDGTVHYNVSETIEIRPYPNPFSYGGSYGGGGADTKEQLDQAIARFQAQADGLKQYGMEKIEVITHEEQVKVEQRSLEKIEAKRAKLNYGTPEPKIEPEPEKQLSLI